MRFNTEGLLSKWGFGDGDMLDDILCDNELDEVDAHEVLIKLVKDMIIPEIDQDVEVFEVMCIHNPIRARAVDGVEIDNYKTDYDGLLTPNFIDIDDELIINIAKGIYDEQSNKRTEPL